MTALLTIVVVSAALYGVWRGFWWLVDSIERRLR